MREHLAALGYPDLYTHGGASSEVASCSHAPIASVLEIIFRLRPALHSAHLMLRFNTSYVKMLCSSKTGRGAECGIHQNGGYREARDEYRLSVKIRKAATLATFTVMA